MYVVYEDSRGGYVSLLGQVVARIQVVCRSYVTEVSILLAISWELFPASKGHWISRFMVIFLYLENLQIRMVLTLHISDLIFCLFLTLLPSIFKYPGDCFDPTHVIQDNIPIWKSLTVIPHASLFCHLIRHTKRVQGLGYEKLGHQHPVYCNNLICFHLFWEKKSATYLVI